MRAVSFTSVSLSLAFSLAFSVVLTGCSLSPTASSMPSTPQSGVAIRGSVHGGQQPVQGTHIYLFAANNTGYGTASISLLNAAATGNSDALGAYVLSNATGGFTITGDYACTSAQQVYLYALGGDSGLGPNSASGFLATLGQCPATTNFLASIPLIQVNEVSTIAAAYAMAGYATDATHISSSGSTLAQAGIANAFANAANLAGIGTGSALTTTPAGNGTVPQATINTLANILASCINSTGPASSPCTTLFSNTLSNGTTGTPPTDTASAAINIAHNPGIGTSALFPLQTATAPFQPVLSAAPNDFAIGIQFTGGGLSAPEAIAIDSAGNAWVANSASNPSVTKFSPSGSFLSGASGYTGGGLTSPIGIAIDSSDSAWVANFSNTAGVVKISRSGAFLSGANGFTGGGLLAQNAIAIDGGDNGWATNPLQGSAVEFSNGGSVLSGTNGYPVSADPVDIAFDGANTVWVTNNESNGVFLNSVTRLSNTGAPLTGSPLTGGGLAGPTVVAIDSSNSAWILNREGGNTNSVTRLSNSGAPASGSPYTGGGLNDPISLAIDGSGNAWLTNFENGSNSVTELANNGSAISGSSGYTAGGALTKPFTLAIDGSGNVWVGTSNGVTELIGAATPVVTPTSAGVKSNTLGTRP
jgi:hypothetical protein